MIFLLRFEIDGELLVLFTEKQNVIAEYKCNIAVEFKDGM